ncbi:hypothetical protein T12_11143 [Trichinella patagoniensis]|uniref:Uncharacterized protein n=1 Tax=Trichinella patagoniensis TaxID=990121 RepID=A0A0V0Z278_9BILA|nr:hypothetical protein T12_11143 [Trichinella patagoniensis]
MRYLTKFLVSKGTNVIIISNLCSRDLLLSSQVSFPSQTSRLKSHHCTTFSPYLGKYAFVRHATRFWKVPWQTNPNLLNKWPLKFACAYLNTQESSPSGTPLKRLQDVRYSMKLSSLLQYFFVLCKSIFLHFLSNWNKFIDIVSGRFELYIKSSSD